MAGREWEEWVVESSLSIESRRPSALITCMDPIVVIGFVWGVLGSGRLSRRDEADVAGARPRWKRLWVTERP